MPKIVGVRFKENGKIYDFACGKIDASKGDSVIVDTEESLALGFVVRETEKDTATKDRALKNIIRVATENDIARYKNNQIVESEVFKYCQQCIKQRELPMALVAVDYRFDGSKIVIYFTAEGRIDFRELVKDLVCQFHIRIEMYQMGIRHQACMVGGIGHCGRILCCSSFLTNFMPVTIRMAKDQNISLKPDKISGMCGRLICCLAYEHEFYEDMKKKFPKVGKKVSTPSGDGKISRINALRETLTVMLESGSEEEFSPGQVAIITDTTKQAESKKAYSKKTNNEK